MSTSSAHRRPAVVVLVVLAAAACLALGWWQWTRYESGSGSFQNLGYALQWPLFAAFVVYAYRRVVHLEAADDPANGSTDGATDGSGEDGPGAAPGRPRSAAPVTELPAGLLPTRATRPDDPADDPVLTEYNAYLAQLDRDSRRPTP